MRLGVACTPNWEVHFTGGEGPDHQVDGVEAERADGR